MADEIIQDPLEAANYLLRQYRDNPDFEFTQEEASLVHGAYGGGVSFIDSRPVMDEASTALFLRSQDESDPSFIASEEEFSILKATEPGAISRIGEGAAGAVEYFKPVITEGIPELIKTASMREPRPGDPSLSATLLEAGARGTMDLGMMAAGASKFIEKAPYMAAGALGMQDDYKSYLNQKTIDQNYQMQAVDKINAERAQGKSIIGLPEGTFAPKAAEAASMVLDPTLAVPFIGPGAKATGVAGRGLRATSKIAGGLETAARATGGAIDLGVEKIGEGVQRVLPGVNAPKTVGAITTGAAAIGIPGAFPIGAKIAGARAGAEVVERGAQAVRIAGEEAMTGPSRMTVMERVAKNQKNPEWLRKAANNSIVSSPITQGAAELGLETGKGAVKSAAVGAGLGYVASGGEEEGIGGGLVIGGGLGTIGGAVKGVATIPAKKALAKQGDVNRLFARQANLGLDVNKIADYVRKDNRPFLDAATLQMMAPDVQVEFHGRDSFMMPENAGINAAGVVKAIPDKSGTTRLLVNMDDMRASGDTVKHEIMHAIMKSPAINKAEGRMAVMSEYGEEGLRRFGNEYARKLLEGERQGRGAPTEAEVRAKANELREGSQRSEPGAGDLDWIADEVLAEQFVGEFRGKDLDSLRRKTLPGTDLLSLQEGYLAPVGRLLAKFGIDTTGPKPTNIDTLFKDNPLVPSKQLRELTTRWFRDRDKYLDGLDRAEKQKDVVLTPGAGNRNLANNPAIKFTRNRKTNLEENDFAVKFPDGTVRAKDPASILAVDKARVADVSRMYDPNAVLERGSPEFGVKIQSDGKPYVGGPKLPEGFYSLDSFNDFTKEVAKTLEDSRQQGETYSVWYQKVGTGEDGSWAQSVKRGLGNIKVGQSEIAFLGWRMSKAGNILAQAVDVTALRGRMLDFARGGKGRINEIWGGDLASYEKDVMKYLDNHANNRPGDEGLGTAKRDAINYLFGITNVANKGVNPMYAEGRPPGSLVKSYRLDRIANSRDTGRTGFFIDYQKQAANLAPGEPNRFKQSDGEYMAAVNRGDMETAQKMVDEAATSSGYNLPNQWHQSKESPTIFDPKYRSELSSMGFHFGTKEQAQFRSTQYDYRGGSKPSLRRFSLKIKNPYEVTHMGSFAPDHLADKMITDGILSESAYERLPGFSQQEIGAKLVRILKKNGYDGLVYKNEREGPGLSYVPFDPSQIKSTDPVTYESGGNVIPLSQRFSQESRDIRFSPATPEQKQFAPASPAEVKDEEFWVSQRNPRAVKATENPLTEKLTIGLGVILKDKELAKKQADLVKKYPGFSPKSKTTEGILGEFVDHVKGNLLYLYDSFKPELREEAKKWYDGARKISEEWAKKYGTETRQNAGVLAVLSPQKDWFMNVSLANRVIDINTNKSKEVFSPEMFNWLKSDPKRAILAKAAKKNLLGKRYDQISDTFDKAVFLRAWDEVNNSRSFDVYSPNGKTLGKKLNDDGSEGKVAWGSFPQIEKGISILGDGARENIHNQLGEEHKVRNFFNNILQPNSKFGDVTIDTHAVAAGLLRPLSGGSTEVLHNLGGGPSSKIVGASGTYALFAEAYRNAAKERGVLPREMQSITWEAIRGLFKPTFKGQAKNKAFVDSVWKSYTKGRVKINEARNTISKFAGGIEDPGWARRSGQVPTKGGTTPNARELLERSMARQDGDGRTGRGVRGTTAGNVQTQNLESAVKSRLIKKQLEAKK